MFHAVVFVMMSRRLSDQSKLTITKGGGKPANPVPNPRRETLRRCRSSNTVPGQWESVVLPASGRTRAA
jgi:hypothetical protein